MIGYLIALALVLRAFPGYSERLVGPASAIRRFLVNVTRINWMFPVLMLWLVGRIFVGFAFGWMQPDLSQWQQIAFEKTVIEAFLPVQVEIPETSFLDMLVALAVLPMATFTTMAVLGGGREDLPDWLVEKESQWVDLDDDDEDGGGDSGSDEDESGERDGDEGASDSEAPAAEAAEAADSDDDDDGLDLAGALSKARGLVQKATKPSNDRDGES
jgi:hypothetical protein